jgi:hypothetical protein
MAHSYAALSADALEGVGGHACEGILIREKQAARRPQFCLILSWIAVLILLSLMAFQKPSLKSIEYNQDCFWKPYEISKFTPDD